MTIKVTWSSRITHSEDNVKYNVPEKAGIYRLLKAVDGGYGVQYVGESDDLQRRLLEHLPDGEKNECIKRLMKDTAYFRFALLEAEKDRLCAESYLYQEFSVDGNGPPCNKQKPQVDPCEINLS